MKNRRSIIVAFLVVAMLVVGVGYAAVSGALTVTGDLAFYNSSYSDTIVDAALTFTDDIVTYNCSATKGEANATGAYQAATIDVNFYDTNDSATSYTATAEYTVQYGTAGQDLPSITVSAASASIDNHTGDTTVYPGNCIISVKWKESSVATQTTDTYTCSQAGDSAILVVTITFDKNNIASDQLVNFNKVIDVIMNYTAT